MKYVIIKSLKIYKLQSSSFSTTEAVNLTEHTQQRKGTYPDTLIRFDSKTKFYQRDPRLLVPVQPKPSPFHSPPSNPLTRAKNIENPESKQRRRKKAKKGNQQTKLPQRFR